jgi:hypothetical protein
MGNKIDFGKMIEIDPPASSPFERLSKNVISYIFSFLSMKDIIKFHSINKFFFKFLSHSSQSDVIWKNICIREYGMKEDIQMKDSQENMKGIIFSK